jgi:hypothetical protein
MLLLPAGCFCGISGRLDLRFLVIIQPQFIVFVCRLPDTKFFLQPIPRTAFVDHHTVVQDIFPHPDKIRPDFVSIHVELLWSAPANNAVNRSPLLARLKIENRFSGPGYRWRYFD